MTDSIIKLKDLHFSYGREHALNGLSMEVPRGTVTAFVGRNGAGKTTTFSVIADFLHLRSGAIEIQGEKMSVFRRNGGLIGLFPQDVSFFPDRTVFSQLVYLARLSGLTKAEAYEKSQDLLDKVWLGDKGNLFPSQLSRGMKMRLGIAQAMLGDPPLVLLDEPTAGLDPIARSQFYKLIAKWREDTTFIISSHQLEELEQICDYLCIIEKGKTLVQEKMDTFLRGTSVEYVIENVNFEIQEFEKRFPQLEGHLDKSKGLLKVNFVREKKTLAEINKEVLPWLLERGDLLELKRASSLSEQYLQSLNHSKEKKERS